MNLTWLLNDQNVVTFLLLFTRFASLFAFLPFFSAATIPQTIKAAIAFYFALVFFPLVAPATFSPSYESVSVAILSEALLGFVVGFILSIIFAAFQVAGEQISMVMGFSTASTFDPMTQTSSQIMSQFLNFWALLLLLSIDGHHAMINYIFASLDKIPLGGFALAHNYYSYLLLAVKNLFIVGFTIAFPIIALSFLADIIFGMIMKTMPTFNLLAVGFPVKIGVSLLVLIATFSSFAVIFNREFEASINHIMLLLP